MAARVTRADGGRSQNPTQANSSQTPWLFASPRFGGTQLSLVDTEVRGTPWEQHLDSDQNKAGGSLKVALGW